MAGGMGGLDNASNYYKDMIKEMNSAKAAASADIPSEYNQVRELYAPGGKYGEGALSRIAAAEKSGVAGTMGQLISSGMSSGSMAAGVRSKYGREAERQRKEVYDTQTDRYSTALNAIATARENRGIRMTNAYQTTASLISGWKSPLEQIAAQGANQANVATISGNFSLAQQSLANQGAMQRQTAQQNWASSEAGMEAVGSKYNKPQGVSA